MLKKCQLLQLIILELNIKKMVIMDGLHMIKILKKWLKKFSTYGSH